MAHVTQSNEYNNGKHSPLLSHASLPPLFFSESHPGVTPAVSRHAPGKDRWKETNRKKDKACSFHGYSCRSEVSGSRGTLCAIMHFMTCEYAAEQEKNNLRNPGRRSKHIFQKFLCCLAR
ncbi:hypothetical protein C0Q70_15611 [Pomacea canaliculata]|uniref:Uncharacterized protein n=1 Tax=Pomacea canaliculata TaxID=400727 RepID=A0A2T7NVC1_POMCA|nr:hypothetical protein C0Q70_15611 [Pomacea canaliculata]